MFQSENDKQLFIGQTWRPDDTSAQPPFIRPVNRASEKIERRPPSKWGLVLDPLDGSDANSRSLGCQVGMRYGQLTVIEDLGGEGTKRRVVCRCDCGDEREYALYRLRDKNEDRRTTRCKKCSPKVKAQNAKRSASKKDYVGHRFGYLLVIAELEPYHYQTEKHHCYSRQVLCRCTLCGKESQHSLNKLRERAKTGAMMACRTCLGRMRRIDLSGRRFGRLRVERMADEDYIYPRTGERCPRYECLCDCGNRTTVIGDCLTRGATKSCGCLAKDKQRRIGKGLEDLTGQQFGRLTVLHRAPNMGTTTMWACRCSCGTIKTVAAGSLKTGLTRSCGCLAREMSRQNVYDYANATFGDLLVIKEVEPYSTSTQPKVRQLLCRCSCGDVRVYSLSSLKSGINSVRRCPVCSKRMSKLERLVIEHLDTCEHGWFTDYRTQMKFDGLTGIGMNPLSYDFALLDENEEIVCLIECQGKQHYEPVEYFGGEESFETQQFHDELKREYAADNGILLIEIPYTVHTLEEVAKYLAQAPVQARAA